MFLTDLCSSGSSVYRVYTQQCGRNLLKLFYNGNVCSLHKVCDNTMGMGSCDHFNTVAEKNVLTLQNSVAILLYHSTSLPLCAYYNK